MLIVFFFFFSSRRRHTRCSRDWSSDVCSSDLGPLAGEQAAVELRARVLGDDVGFRTPLEDGWGHGVPDEGVLTRVAGELGEEGRILERLAQVGELATQRLAFEGRQGGEILLHWPHQPDPGPVATELVEGPDEPGDGSLRGRRRAVATLPTGDELHPARRLLRHGDLHDL